MVKTATVIANAMKPLVTHTVNFAASFNEEVQGPQLLKTGFKNLEKVPPNQ